MSHLLATWECALCECELSTKTARYIHDVDACERTHDEKVFLTQLKDHLSKAKTAITTAKEAAEEGARILTKAGEKSVKLGQKAVKTGGKLAKVGGKAAKIGGKVAKVGKVATRGLGRLAPGISLALDVIDIVGAAKEKATAFPLCKTCQQPDIQEPGCRTVCKVCGKGCDHYTEASSDSYCFMVCESCHKFNTCMICLETATKRQHRKAFKIRIHSGPFENHLEGTNKEGTIVGASLSIAGTALLPVPVFGWILGGALTVAGLATNVASSALANPTEKIWCTGCKKNENDNDFERGCQDWCYLCNVAWTDESRCCLALCEDCTDSEEDNGENEDTDEDEDGEQGEQEEDDP